MNANSNFGFLFEQLPEQALWRLLQELLATSYDASITLKKALECQGDSRELARFRQARKAVDSNAEPRALWRTYLNLSTSCPVRTSAAGTESIH